MYLPNAEFIEFPIEFKEINPEDFPNFIIENDNNKIIIEPDSNGYINEALKSCIDYDKKNTVIINAAVGQGKTFSIIEIIKDYYDNENNYLIVVAVPYVSLVQQYLDDIISKGIPEDQIYRYEYIGRQTHIDAWNSKIQIITANGLLGNPGEDKFINEINKRNYLDYLTKKCSEDNRKVIFIYDEIHDTIQNFKEKYIFNLWKWKNVIHKNLIISATFNEASKIVIEYLAELTDNTIQIIESKRTKFPEKQSDLYLHFNPAKTYKHDNNSICNLVESLILKNKAIDILSFSRILGNDICTKTDSGIGKLLIEKYGEVQNCVSELDNNQNSGTKNPTNRFDKDKCNVGTNFKTGISISKENHAFIVIMPPIGRKGKFKNSSGIFTDGVNSIIQALARQRNTFQENLGEIHIVLPPPIGFNYDSINHFNEIQKEKFIMYYEEVCNQKSEQKSDYISINSQKDLINEFYTNTLKENIINEIEKVRSTSRENKIRLDFEELKIFKLNTGEKYLYSTYQFFGKDLSSYVTYCAFTNQFINCNLKGIKTKPILYFKETKIQWRLEKFFNEEYCDLSDIDFSNSFHQIISDNYFYHQLKNEIFSNYNVIYIDSSNNKKSIFSFSEKNFELQFLAFIQRKCYPNNLEFIKRFHDEGYYFDDEYSRGEYFRNCISHSNYLFPECENYQSNLKDLIKAYRILDSFRQKIIANSLTVIKKGEECKYVFSTPKEEFILEHEKSDFIFMYETLINLDSFINKDIFEFKRAYLRTDEFSKIVKSFYSYLLNDFFILYDSYVYEDSLQTRIKIIEEIEIPNHKSILNLIRTDETNFPESYWESEVKKNEFESLKKAATKI